MKLIISVINNEDSGTVINELMKGGFRLTRLTSTGEFLKEGNTTVLIGTQDELVDKALDIIKNFSSTREHEIEHRDRLQYSLLADSLKVSVGGAVVFIVDVEQFIKF